MYAARYNNFAVVQLLINLRKDGKYLVDLTLENNNGLTALALATRNSSVIKLIANTLCEREARSKALTVLYSAGAETAIDIKTVSNPVTSGTLTNGYTDNIGKHQTADNLYYQRSEYNP